MEPAMIMVLVLCAGVLALLAWFEINSRRNEASKKQAAKLAQSAVEPRQKEAPSKAESEIEKSKVA
jgi:Tfp pilus assembly protein PilV